MMCCVCLPALPCPALPCSALDLHLKIELLLPLFFHSMSGPDLSKVHQLLLLYFSHYPCPCPVCISEELQLFASRTKKKKQE